MSRLAFIVAVIAVICGLSPAHSADAGFTQFIASLWPEAQAAGVSRATFDAETRGLEPDYKLPDLILPGRPATGAPSQAEFVQVPADYLKEASIARLATEGQRLMQKHREALAAIEHVPLVHAADDPACEHSHHLPEHDRPSVVLDPHLVQLVVIRALIVGRKKLSGAIVHARDPSANRRAVDVNVHR